MSKRALKRLPGLRPAVRVWRAPELSLLSRFALSLSLFVCTQMCLAFYWGLLLKMVTPLTSAAVFERSRCYRSSPPSGLTQ